jgi:hypothetical protein
MPRAVKDDPRDCFKTFRFTAGEVTRLEARARARGQTLSTFVRTALLGRDDPESGPSWGSARAPPAAEPPAPQTRRLDPAMRILIDQVRRVGTNLNQIAHRMNELRIPPPRELTLILDEIRGLVRKVREP